ncbi:MAG: alkaline phosphatase family protein [Candidatus Cybelea sp.]
MRRIPVRSRPLLAATVAFCFSACGGKAGFGTPSTLPAAVYQGGSAVRELGHAKSKIQHVVIIIQENRSFNNLFYGYPGAKTANYGYGLKDEKKIKIDLQPIPLETTWDLEHNPNGFVAACHGNGETPGTDCRMDGFNHETWNCNTPGHPKCPIEYPPYAFVPHKETKPYFEMARQYVLADEMYASNFDSTSFMAHQFIIAGVNPDRSIGKPAFAWGCPGGAGDQISILGLHRAWPKGSVRPCWDPTTLGDELDEAGLSWSFYATPIGGNTKAPCGHKGIDADGSGSSDGRGIWSAYQTIAHICYSPSKWNLHILTPPNRFLNVMGRGGRLDDVTWITPTFANSDHGGSGSATGPSWVTSVVNAIGRSKYWSSTAIFIFWDDYGGWYDPEPPKYLDDAGLGFRLPMLIISPYAKEGYVSHVHYEHGTILKFVENTFGLARMNLPHGSDVRANPPDDAFDFSQAPRKFVPIHAPLDENYFKLEPLDLRPPDSD